MEKLLCDQIEFALKLVDNHNYKFKKKYQNLTPRSNLIFIKYQRSD